MPKRATPPETKKPKAAPRRQEDHGGLQGIARGAVVLRLLARHPAGLSLREIGRLAEMPLATVQRLVTALSKENLLISASRNGGVRLGPGLIPLAAVAKQFDLVELARPFITALAKEVDETTDLSLFDREKAVVIEQFAGTQELRAVSAVGDSLPLYCTASGKALLAALSNDDLSKLRRRLRLESLTKNTIASWARLEHELATIRETGLALDNEEHRYGVCGVAVSLKGPNGEVIAVGIKAPIQRFRDCQKTMTRSLVKHCQTLQRHMLR